MNRLLPPEKVYWNLQLAPVTAQGAGKGRDYNAGAFTAWTAGGGIQGGTDDLGFEVVVDPAYCYDLHATPLHLLGLSQEKLSFCNNGIKLRLTGVHGYVIKEIIA